MNSEHEVDGEPTQPIRPDLPAAEVEPDVEPEAVEEPNAPTSPDTAGPAVLAEPSAQPLAAITPVPPRPATPWAPPAAGSAMRPDLPAPTAAPAAAPAAQPMAPSLMPPPPNAPPTAADLTVRMPTSGTTHRRERGGPGWLGVAAIALLVGLLGGLVGALGYDRLLSDDPSGPGYVDGGLSDVDLAEQAPLAAPDSVTAVAQAVLPSTVQILADYEGQEAGATGSGWVMDGDGHIVTNNHVVANAAQDDGRIVVIDNERNRYDATVVGRSPVYDLAILYVEDNDTLVPAKLGHSAKLQVGEPVVAIGSPLSLPSTVTSGIVSYLHRPVTTGSPSDDASYIDAIQTDAAINPGNSGGPLVNQQGEVVGVNSAIATAGGGSIDSEAGNIGVGFAIPVEQVRVTADQILKTGKAQYPIIGATVETGGLPTGDGARIDEVSARGPADEGGLQEGDRITHVDGDRVADGVALIVAIRTHQPGETIELTVVRDSGEMKVQVTLDGVDG